MSDKSSLDHPLVPALGALEEQILKGCASCRHRSPLIALLLTALLAFEGWAQQTNHVATPDNPAGLGDPSQHMAGAPGSFHELPPNWAKDSGNSGYILPHEVADNYHYDQDYRPQFHFTALHGHIGDATGLIVYKGRYHLFFMFDPWQRSRGWHKAWGHAVSYDLLHWRQQPPVTDTIVDGRSGSGCGVVDWNNSSGLRTGPEKALLIFYTDYWRGTCIKYSNDGGDSWQYYRHNPVLSGFDDIRDPLVFWHEPDQSWRMVRYEKRGFVFYASQNLVDWVFLSRITDAKYYECPDMFELPIEGSRDMTRWVLVNGNGTYLIGDFDGRQFIPETDLLTVDHGRNLYATQTWEHTRSSAGAVVQMAFMGYNREILRTWEGQMCFPCELTLHDTPEGVRMHRRPIPAIENLHQKTRRWLNRSVDAAELALGEGDALDIRLVVEPQTATSFGLVARGEEISYVVSEQQIRCLGATAPLAPVDGRVQLQVLVDRASIEVFGNDGQISMSSLFFPGPTDQQLQFFARGGSTKIVELEVHSVESIWQSYHARQNRPLEIEPPAAPPLAEVYERSRNVFDFDDPQVRSKWRLVEGDLPAVFTTSTRKDFRPPHSHFIGTSEFDGGDELTGVIESPPFEIVANAYSLVLSGGYDTEKTFVALADAISGRTLFHVACPHGHRMVDCWIDTSHLVGRKVFVRVVDKSRGRWGKTNLGGVFEGRRLDASSKVKGTH